MKRSSYKNEKLLTAGNLMFSWYPGISVSLGFSKSSCLRVKQQLLKCPETKFFDSIRKRNFHENDKNECFPCEIGVDQAVDLFSCTYCYFEPFSGQYFLNQTPLFFVSGRENATPSSATSPLGSCKGVPPPPRWILTGQTAFASIRKPCRCLNIRHISK